MFRRFIFSALLSGVALGEGTTVQARDTGRIEGRVQRLDSSAIAGVKVVVHQTGDAEITRQDGSFGFPPIPVGEYTVVFTLGEHTETLTRVRVEVGQTNALKVEVDWDLHFADSITVHSASRGLERIVEAPAAITALSTQEIELGAAPGQLPKLLEFSAGVELTQSGVYDFNLNVRGFNTFLTRRIQVLVDGRDTYAPLTTSQEWYSLGFLTEDLESMELVRGPSAALYGPNSFNGVLNVVTRAPRDAQGVRLRLVGGELDTLNANLGWAGRFGQRSSFKLLMAHSESRSFTRSRNETTEYGGILLEAVPLATDEVEFDSALFRMDHDLANDHTFTMEAGYSDGGGEMLLSSGTRFQILEIERGWLRLNYSAEHWNALSYYNTRVSDVGLNMGAGSINAGNDYNLHFELQGHRHVADSRIRVVGGASYREEHLNTSEPPSGATFIFEDPVRYNKKAVFGQLDFDLAKRLKLVLAVRWDEGTLHESRISPKGSLVYGLSQNHTLRLGYNEAFQVGNALEIFLDLPVGAIDLSAIEEAFAPSLGGVSLGLANVPFLALGNADLRVEQIRGFELGYHGILGRNTFLTLDVYSNQMKDFITELLPGVNPEFGPYRAPLGTPSDVVAEVEMAVNSVPGLTNDPVTGAAQLVFSHGNTARIESRGVELALSSQVHEHWRVEFNYAWFDFEIKEQSEEQTVSPNHPENKLSLGLIHQRGAWNASLRWRWVDDFDWSAGIFVGPVPSYSVTSFSATYEISANWELGLNVSNLFDNEHYEAFGGDILSRRALAHVTYSW